MTEQRGRWRVVNRADDPYSRNTGEKWWVFPPGDDSPEETWHSWDSAMWWANRRAGGWGLGD